ncbi:MAG: glycosyltransferase family 2 protein [Lachnospiraceae bacterium]|nr:glycosyltransferase family 2 protein [Lachnospiraceae bacterium]
MPGEKKISIIVPCHNSADTLDRTWKSIEDQTMPLEDIEVIFVDDASDDDGKTWQLLNEIEKIKPESVIIIQLEKNLRQGGARNAALKYVSGEYIMFLDSDDTYVKECCQELYDIAEMYNADIIQFRHSMVSDGVASESVPVNAETSGRVLVYELRENEDVRRAFLTMQVAGFNCNCTSKMYSSALVRECGALYAENVIYEEPKFVYPVFLYADRIVLADKAYYEYHWHMGSTMTSLLGQRLMEHPKVQLELMADIIDRQEIYEKYREEVDYYFFRTFYVETLVFMYVNKGYVSVEAMSYMQEICKRLIPNIANNRYIIADDDMLWFVETLQKVFSDETVIFNIGKEAAGRLIND